MIKGGVVLESNKTMNSKLVYSAAVLYSVITGLSFLFGKMALSNETIKIAGPIDMLAHRFSVSFIVIAGLVLFKIVKVDFTLDKIKRIIPISLLNPIAFFGFQAFGLQYATSSEAGIITAAAPVFALILASLILGEKSTTLQKVSIFISVIGVVYITLMKSSSMESSSFDLNNIKGIVFVLLSALSFAGYSVVARVMTKDFTSTELSFTMITMSFLFFNIIALIRNLMAGTLSTFFTPFADLNFTISIIYLGVLSSLVTSILTNYVLSYIQASKMSVFINLGTVISIVAGFVFLKEKIFYYHIIGSILIVGGVLGTNFLDSRSVNKKIKD